MNINFYDTLADIEEIEKRCELSFDDLTREMTGLSLKGATTPLNRAEKRQMKRLNTERTMLIDLRPIFKDFKERIMKINNLKED